MFRQTVLMHSITWASAIMQMCWSADTQMFKHVKCGQILQVWWVKCGGTDVENRWSIVYYRIGPDGLLYCYMTPVSDSYVCCTSIIQYIIVITFWAYILFKNYRKTETNRSRPVAKCNTTYQRACIRTIGINVSRDVLFSHYKSQLRRVLKYFTAYEN